MATIKRDIGRADVPKRGMRVFTPVLLILLVPGMALLDTSIGLLGADRPSASSPGQVVRGLVLVLAIFLVLLSRRLGRLRVWVMILMAAGSVGVVSGVLLRPDSVYFDLVQIARVLFGPLFVVFLAWIFRRWGVRRTTVLLVVAGYGALCGTLLIGFWILGSGLPTYGEYSGAFAGFFAAPNSTGLSMLVALAAATYLVLARPSPVSVLFLLPTLGGLALLGTRAALIGAFLVPVTVLIANRSLLGHARWHRWVFAVTLVVAALSGFASYQQSRLASDEYLARRFQVLSSGDLSRIRPLDESLEKLRATGPLALFLGQGASAYRTSPAGEENVVAAEIDWLDLLGAHGVLFTVVLYGFYLRYLFLGQHVNDERYPTASSVLYVSLLVFLGHGALAGHALVSPTASGIVAPLLAVASTRAPRS